MRRPPLGPKHWHSRLKQGCHATLAGFARLPGGVPAFVHLDHRLRGGHAAYRLVMSLAAAGRLPLARTVADHALTPALRSFRPTLPAETPPVRQDAASAAMLTSCLHAALDALAALPAIQPFLAYGTLLGWARDGGFLPGDSDIDLGVLHPPAAPPAVETALTRAGFILTRRADPAWPGVTQAIHPDGGGLDVVYFKPEGDCFHTHSVLFGERIERGRPRFNLTTANLAGRSVWVPAPPEHFLVPNYGAWRQRPDYYHNLLSPDLVVNDPASPGLALLARAELLRLLAIGHPRPLAALLELMMRRFPTDPLWPRVHARLSSQL